MVLKEKGHRKAWPIVVKQFFLLLPESQVRYNSKNCHLRRYVFERLPLVHLLQQLLPADARSLLQFSNDTTFVEIETSPLKFEKRIVKTGISDGIQIEVLDGISPNDKIKVAQLGLPIMEAKEGKKENK
jgi:hypothetical protein